MKNIAVILCGSGYKDGSEIRESVAVLHSLSARGAKVQCFAPDAPQFDVVNCLTGEAQKNESRNMLTESARIARGQVLPLSKLNAKNFDGIIIPGGFGAAKNLCTFAQKSSQGTVLADLEKILHDFHSQKKPIGAVCIAPAILALAFKGQNLELTLGAAGDSAKEIEKLGHRHIVKEVTDCHVDQKNKIATSPAYMYGDAPLHKIFQGIDKLVGVVIELS